MKKLITSLATLAVAATFAAAEDTKPAAPAAGDAKPKRDPAEAFKKLDTNSDNAISLEEFKTNKKDPARAETAFKAKDKDNDGKLTLEEFKARPAKKDK
jgi:Ca2+-binding EF-hand superfamily protein